MGAVIAPSTIPKCATIFETSMEEQNSPIVFSEWLKRRRRALDLTQDELAQRVGCSVGALRKIESGDRRPSKQLAGLLARALGIPDEDQQTFIRVARGELSLERLRQPAPESRRSFADVSFLRQAQQGASPTAGVKPASPLARLPLQATPLIGRDIELAAMGRIFNEPQCRLLTLTGIGGIGKTRLAIEFAARNLSAFPGGVFYIPLTPVNSPEKIVPAIADVLDFVFSGPADPKRQLLNYLSSNIKQEALFIFDNLEQLLVQVSTEDKKSGLVELICEMLERLPNISILGTSRERLNLHGEWTYEVHGLSVPPDHFVGSVDKYDSIRLFVKSAQRIKMDFQATVDEQASLIRVCQLVEGAPLAIELAAAWVGILSCREIAQEIQANMDFLTTSMRDIPERHRSIRATFDHSWKLLSDEERFVLCQLSVFHGGFDRYAAEQIAGASLPVLASLSAKSLVRRSESGRYDLHELIRQYAQSNLKLYSRNLETCARHSEYYLVFLHDRENSLKSASQQEAVRQLTGEIDNILTAWAWAINNQEFALLGRAGRAFGWYFEITGLYREGIEQLELLVQAIKAVPPNKQWDRVLGLMLVHQALMYFRKGEFDHAQKLYEESIAVLRPTGDHVLLADGLIFLGTILHLNGEYERSRSIVVEGFDFARTANDRWYVAFAIYTLGHIASLMGRYEEGYEQMLAGIAMWRTLGDPHAIALGLNFLVPTLTKIGRYEEAKAFMQESITLCEQSKNRWGMGTAYRYLGLATIAEGNFTEAQTYLRKSLEIFGEDFVGWDIARSLTYLGYAAIMAGDLTAARKVCLDALHSAIEAKAIPIALDALVGLGNLKAQSGKAEEALALCYYTLSHSFSEDETKDRAEKLRAVLEIKLNSKQITEARLMAAENSFDEIVNVALQLS